jgi:hypothetical protein
MMETNQDQNNQQSDAAPDTAPNAAGDVIGEVTPAKHTRRGVLLAAGGVGLLAVLGGAAYVAGGLLNAPKPAAEGGGGIEIVGGPGGGQRKTLPLPKIKNAPEIPATEPDAMGLYLRRQDNSIFIGTGQIEITVQRDPSGKTQGKGKHTGPEVEVVINRDTSLYRDKTPITMEAAEQGKEIQQVVELIASLDDLVDKLSDTDSLMVWGARNGDRIIAKTVVHRPPMFFGTGK